MPRVSSYREELSWLYGLQRFGIKLGLETTQRLLAELASRSGGLQTAAPWGRYVIHVAGTNGKGSVCAMIDAIARAGGYRTGLYTSPHLITFRERIRINGEMISEDAVADRITAVRNLVRDWNPYPTFFEITTALALHHFADVKIDIVILETGLGGRLDATNAVQSNVSVITPIAFDHEQWLGHTLREIAGEKAGIIKRRTPVISAPQPAEAAEVIRVRAAECEAPLQIVSDSYEEAPVALRGSHQKQNAAVAVAAIHAAQMDIDDAAIARGLLSVDWPARFQRWDERTIIDGAHNPAAARVLAETWQENFGDKRATLVLAVLNDKDVRGMLKALAPVIGSVLLPRIRSQRALPPDALAQTLSTISPKLQYSITPSIAAALDSARATANPILLTGSLHFAGEALAHLRGEPAAFEECAQ